MTIQTTYAYTERQSRCRWLGFQRHSYTWIFGAVSQVDCGIGNGKEEERYGGVWDQDMAIVHVRQDWVQVCIQMDRDGFEVFE